MRLNSKMMSTLLAGKPRTMAPVASVVCAIVALYFGTLAQTTDATGAMVRGFPASKVLIILLFSLIGIAGSYGVAWFGIRVNTFANSRTAFASLTGKPYPNHAIPLKAGMSIGMLLI